MYTPMSILITGGAGFIGSGYTNMLGLLYSNTKIIVLDKLDYCSRLNNLDSNKNLTFIKGDILSQDLINHILSSYNIDTVVHFAAQTHVSNSFWNSLEFTRTNVLGTHTLIECCRLWGKIKRFVHISSDEVYGESNNISYDESQRFDPTSPYSASKAAAEHIVKSYFYSYNLPILIVRMNNVYGRFQYPEKVIPRFIVLLLTDRKMTIQGKGNNRRSFIHLDDACRAINIVLENGIIGEAYNIVSNNEYSVLEIADKLRKEICPEKSLNDVIRYIDDRNFNDTRYLLDGEKLYKLGWVGELVKFDDGLIQTIDWYRDRLLEYKDIPDSC